MVVGIWSKGMVVGIWSKGMVIGYGSWYGVRVW